MTSAVNEKLLRLQEDITAHNNRVLNSFEAEVKAYRSEVLDKHVKKLRSERKADPAKHDEEYYQQALRRVMKDLDAEFVQQRMKLETKLMKQKEEKLVQFVRASMTLGADDNNNNNNNRNGSAKKSSLKQKEDWDSAESLGLPLSDGALRRIAADDSALLQQSRDGSSFASDRGNGDADDSKVAPASGNGQVSTMFKAQTLLKKGLSVVRNMIQAMDAGKAELRMLKNSLEKVLADSEHDTRISSSSFSSSAAATHRDATQTSSSTSRRGGGATKRVSPVRVSSTSTANNRSSNSSRSNSNGSKLKKSGSSHSPPSRSSTRRTRTSSGGNAPRKVSFDLSDRELRQLKRDFLFYDKMREKTSSRKPTRTSSATTSRRTLSTSMSGSGTISARRSTGSKKKKQPVSMVSSSRAKTRQLSTSTSKNSRLNTSTSRRSSKRKTASPRKTAPLDVSLTDLMGELNTLMPGGGYP